MQKLCEEIFEEGKGILRLTPTWVPRSFCRPGKRIKLHPDDYYVLGLERGGIDERWFASTTHASNGGLEPDDEGMSYVIASDNERKVLLKDMVDVMQDKILGKTLWEKYHRWPMFSKFFDNAGPLPHHIHHRAEHAELVQQDGKPEMYFFPSQVNNHGGEFPFTFFGVSPEVTKDEVKEALVNFEKGDNKLLDLSVSYKLSLDTGWDVPPGVLHAPGSLCTYEPQYASDVYAMYQSVLYGGQCVPTELLWKDCPEDKIGDFDYLMDVIDWDVNTDKEFRKNRFMKPIPLRDMKEMEEDGCVEEWICYKCKEVAAKRVTVKAGTTVVLKDEGPYGMICLQGHGKFGAHKLETPTLIRYGQVTYDEYFVSEGAAHEGVTIENASSTEDIVILQHFSEIKAIEKYL